MTENHIADETVVQLETIVTEAVKVVVCFDTADKTAVEKVATIKADLRQAEKDKQKVACDRVGAYWVLGRAIIDLEAVLAANKNKHSEDTPRKRAIELAGGNARYQKAKSIGSFFNSETDATKAAMSRSFNEILNEIARVKDERRKAKGQKTPGRKPTVITVAKNVKPMAYSLPNLESEMALPSDLVAEEETEVTPPLAVAMEEMEETPSAINVENGEASEIPFPITPEEFRAVETFVAAVGGWNRATYLIEEGHKKWLQNQKR
jgi:hypothetical protein